MTTQITITVRNGTTQHGNPHLLCSPPLWTDIVTFFLGNYAAHAATVVTYPGESILSTIGAIFFALAFPVSGIVRGMGAIARHAVVESDPLEQAARAGALCMVVRTKDWVPLDGENLKDVVWRGSMNKQDGKVYNFFGLRWKRRDRYTFAKENVSDIDTLDPQFYWPPWMFESSSYWTFVDTLHGFVAKDKMIHGFYKLSPGYALAHVPRDTVVQPSTTPLAVDKTCTIATNYSVAKALVAIIQLCFACITLTHNAATEIADNGYGSYNLTVVQYALMSLLNLMGNAINPTYPALFLVHSEIMDEAILRGSIFDGVVGRIVPDNVEIVGIEGNQLNGKVRIVDEISRSTKVLPEGWEVRHTVTGRPYFVDHLRKRATWTDPSTESIIETRKSTYMFQADLVSRAEIMSHVYVSLRDSHRPTLANSAAHQSVTNEFAGEPTEFKLLPSRNESTSRWVGITNPTLFVPCCPCFRRKKHNSYSVHYDRVHPNRMGMIHFVEFHANRRIIFGSILTQYGSLLLGGVTIAIIAAFTRFHKGDSSLATRAIFMTWLAAGMFIGSGIHGVMIVLQRENFWLVLGLIGWCIPAGSGFYQVVVVLQRYGNCIRIG